MLDKIKWFWNEWGFPGEEKWAMIGGLAMVVLPLMSRIFFAYLGI